MFAAANCLSTLCDWPMENRLTRFIYDRSPVFLQHLYTTAFGLQKRLQRYGGRRYREFVRLFEESARWSFAELRAYQDERLRSMIRLAYDHVPFYRRRFAELKLTPDDVRSADDLPKLPYLTKDDVRAAGADLLADNYPRRRAIAGPTSGSTGFPMTIWWSRQALQMEYAFHWTSRRPGVRQGERYASFTGLQIVRADRMKPPFWRINLAANQRCYSVFHMTDRTIPLYLDDLQRHPCAWFEGYATPIYILARYVLDQGYAFTASPRAVFTTSEKLLPGYREAIEAAFGTTVYDQYGQHEKTASITEYPCGHMHDDMIYGLTEFVPVEGGGEAGQVVEIIGTGLYNEAMPLIRYQVGDLAVLPDAPPRCTEHAGRIVSEIHGRTGHVVVTADGRRISNISVIVKRCRNVRAVQVVQRQVGRAVIRVVREPAYSVEDEVHLLEQFRLKMGRELEIAVDYVDEIPLTAAGKFLSIVSEVGHTIAGQGR